MSKFARHFRARIVGRRLSHAQRDARDGGSAPSMDPQSYGRTQSTRPFVGARRLRGVFWAARARARSGRLATAEALASFSQGIFPQ